MEFGENAIISFKKMCRLTEQPGCQALLCIPGVYMCVRWGGGGGGGGISHMILFNMAF